MTLERCRNSAGFSLAELLIVLAMFGLVTGAIYSTYVSHRRNAASQGEVTEVQQNLRVALDYLTRDLKMAGALVPAGTPAIAAATGSPLFPTYSTNLACNTASAEARFARIESGATVTGSPLSVQLVLEAPAGAEAPNCVDGFRVGDKLRLIHPVDGSFRLSPAQTLVVSDIPGNPDRGNAGETPPIPPKMTVSRSDGSPLEDAVISPSDVIAKVADTSFPMTVSYFLVQSGTTVNGFTCPANQRCLVREVNRGTGGADIIATNLSSLRFAYLDDSYHEWSTPFSLASVRAVRVTLVGATARTATLSGAARLREVTTVVKLRNRR